MAFTKALRLSKEFPVKLGADTEPLGVKDTVPLVPDGVKETVPFVGTLAGHEIAPSAKAPLEATGTGVGHATEGCVNMPAAIVGTPAGQDTVGCVNVPAAIVGTPAGHAFVPEGVKDTVPLVPVAVSVCVCVPRADPVNVGAATVPEGV